MIEKYNLESGGVANIFRTVFNNNKSKLCPTIQGAHLYCRGLQYFA